jgi:hypothetical protein
MKTTYQFEHFQLTYDHSTGDVTTLFPDGTTCRVWPNEEDEKHAYRLGLSAGEHKLLHELVHSGLAMGEGQSYCPIVWAQAHKQPMPDDAAYREQMIMALSYMVMQQPMEYSDWWGRIGWVQDRANPYEIVHRVCALFNGRDIHEVIVK